MSSNKESMRNILKIILKGYTIHERSWDGRHYQIEEIPAMIKAADDDEMVGYTAYLMGKEGNDIQSQAELFGVGYDRDGNVIDLPPCPFHGDSWSSWDVKSQMWVEHPNDSYKNVKKEEV